MRFAAWPFALLLVLIPALAVLYGRGFRRQRQALAAFVAEGPAARTRLATRRRWGGALCLLGAVAGLILALMQPQWGEGGAEVPLRGRDLIVVLDVSDSMRAEDVRPNRLAQAKAAVRSLVAAVQGEGGHRLGLLTFAGRPDVQAPLTRDYGLFLKRLEDATTDSVGRRGTAIGEALRAALDGFGELAPAYTDLILISDGEDHGGLPLEAAEMLATLGVGLYVVGVGDPNASAPIPIGEARNDVHYLVHDGQEVQSRMREGLLIGLANAAGGIYLGGEPAAARLDRLYAEAIAGKPRHALESATSRDMTPRYRVFVLLAALLLILEMVLRRRAPMNEAEATGTEPRVGAGGGRGRLVVGLAALLPILTGDQAAERAVREGNALYQAGQYEAALRAYEAAARAVPDSATIHFNRGNALFKNRDQEAALDQYLAALASEDPGLAGRAKYNIGVIKYREALAAAQRYEDALALVKTAVGYFRDSLKLDPGLDDARYNLELAYRFQHQIEQQLLQAQRNARDANNQTSLRRGQALSDLIRNEGSGQRLAMPEQARRPHGQRGNEAPDNFAANQEQGKAPDMARLPMAIGPDVARQLMEQLRERLEAAEIRRQEQRRRQLEQAAEPTPW